MAAYVIVEINVTDPKIYEDYRRVAPDSIARYGGRYVVRGGQTQVFEGDWQPKRIVVLEFDSLARARQWWDSEEYRGPKALRHRSATTRMIAVEGA